MRILPMVERELRVGARHRSVRWSRVGVAGGAALATAAALTMLEVGGGGVRGDALFRFLAFLMFGYCALAGVFLTADCLSREKREGTLGLLFLTDLRGYDVVLGKLVARGVWAAYGWVAVLPVVAVAFVMGGVTSGEFWRVAFVCAVALAFSLALGLAVSSVAWAEYPAMFATFLVTLALSLGGWWGGALGGWIGRVATSLSPFSTFWGAFETGFRLDPGRFWWGLGSGLSLGAIALGVACWRLPRSWQLGRRSEPWERRPRRSGSIGVGPEPVTGNPVAWLVGRRFLVSRRALHWTLAGVGVLGLAMGMPFMLSPAAMAVWGAAGQLMSLALRVVVIFQAARFLVDARQSGAIELLVSTPLTAEAIIGGQLGALRDRFRLPAIVVALLLVLPTVVATVGLIVAAEGGLPWIFQLAMVSYRFLLLFTDLYAGVLLSLYLALASRNPARAAVMALLFAVVLPAFAFCVPRLLIDLPIILICRNRLRRDFYTLVRRSYEGAGGRRTVARSRPPPLRATA